MCQDQKYLLECVNHSVGNIVDEVINKPTVILKEYINEVLQNINSLSLIIIKYTGTCYYCKNYLEENDAEHCQCVINNEKKQICKYCYKLYTRNEHCNTCSSNNVASNNQFNLICVVNDCKNRACYGNIDYAIFCIKHSYNKILLSYTTPCKIANCCNRGINISLTTGYHYCSLHKTDANIIDIVECPGYENKESKKCDLCRIKVVFLTCSCNKSYCNNCTRANVFCFNNILYCSSCCFNKLIDKKKCVRLNNDLICQVFGCDNIPEYYSHEDNYYFCPIHARISRCVKIKKKYCSYDTCYAIPVVKNKLCTYHSESIKKYNLTQN